MTQNELMESVKHFFTTCQEIIDTRNQKYSNPEDALFNIEQGAMTAKLTVERALVHWLSDKVARLSNLTTAWENGDEKAAEVILDTLRDISGYAALYNAELGEWIPKQDEQVNVPAPPDLYPFKTCAACGSAESTRSATCPGCGTPYPVETPESSANSAFEKFKSLMGINK